MWISRKKWEDMERRLRILENGVHSNAEWSHKHEEPGIFEDNLPGSTIYIGSPYVKRKSVPVTTVVYMILRHLGLLLTVASAKEERPALIRKPPKKKVK